MSEEEIRLDQTKKVFDIIARLIKNGSCSYRYLIYDLLGFDYSTYVELMNGLTITNAICDYEECKQKISAAIQYIKENANYGIQEKCCLDDLNYYSCDELLEILGDKENE